MADKRSFLVPEIVQTSDMDCGPAALKAMLEGFGLRVDYGRLREACQTDVDGSSINTIEDVALSLGLTCQQVLAPVDHLFISSAQLLPAIVVTLKPGGATHFVIVWRVIGSWVQVMDPAQGRRWLKRSSLIRDIYRHHLVTPASDWRAWAAGDGFCNPLRARMRQLGIPTQTAESLLAHSLNHSHWRPLAALDAAVRFTKSLVEAGGAAEIAEIERLVTLFFAQASEDSSAQEKFASAAAEHPFDQQTATIPLAYWSVLPSSSSAELLTVYGAVALTVTKRQQIASVDAEPYGADRSGVEDGKTLDATARPILPIGLRSVLAPPVAPVRAAIQALRADGLLAPSILLLTVIAAAFSVTLEATVLRGLMDIHIWLVRDSLRVTLAVSILGFAVLLYLLETTLTTLSLRLGRRLETRLRIALLTKIPQIEERYFHSRLISDMAYRAYSLTQLHGYPGLGADLLRQVAQLLFTTLGVIWLAPQSALFALTMLATVMGLAVISQPLLDERDLRVRTHASALSRFYLDALLGLLPIRTHSAERVVRREHEILLVTWMRAMRELANIGLILQALVAVVGFGGAGAIVLRYLSAGGEASGVLLLLYWTLYLPVLGQALITHIQQYSRVRNHLLRVLEPLGAPVKTASNEPTTVPNEPATAPMQIEESNFVASPTSNRLVSIPEVGVAVEMCGVTAVVAGRPILYDLNLAISPGEHLAIIGASGSGKSSLVGLLLGWLPSAQGEIWVDRVRLTDAYLQSLRQTTAWVDPAVLLWNRSLAANLLYGLPEEHQDIPLSDALAWADLDAIVSRLPDGLATMLGEGGGLISGGEGQRVRFGRALLRPSVRLVILDEPFRWLDYVQRRQLLRNARQRWHKATLLCITHDVVETQQFDRVLIMEEGRIAEVGAPQSLIDDAHSRYRAWLDASSASWQSLWNSAEWQRMHLEHGRVHQG